MGELNKTLKSLAKLFGGSIPMEDVIRELKARGFDEPEALIKRLLSEGRVYEARKGFLSVLGDGYD